MVAQTRATQGLLGRWAWLPVCVIAFCGVARSAAEEEESEGWNIEEAHIRFNYFDQKGFGYQSQAGPGPAGSERLRVYNPMFYVRARQNSKVEHTVTFPIDVITSASTDAIDVTTSGSRRRRHVTTKRAPSKSILRSEQPTTTR